jgi:hypothetical protein
VTLTATFVAGIHKDGTFPYILYWDAESQTMQVGAWGDALTPSNYLSKMLFFKFGGVVGFTNNNGTWGSGNIKFNPVTDSPSYATYTDIPKWNDSSTTEGYISSSSYHTLANVKAGRGDPCKLVGLTVAQIQAGVIDNGLYRLPTRAENRTFFGSSSPSDDPTYSTWTTNPATRTFHKSDPANAVLPAAGYRSFTNSGAASYRGTEGRYWSSTPNNSTDGFRLYFDSTNVVPSGTDYSGVGLAVRCVPQ